MKFDIKIKTMTGGGAFGSLLTTSNFPCDLARVQAQLMQNRERLNYSRQPARDEFPQLFIDALYQIQFEIGNTNSKGNTRLFYSYLLWVGRSAHIMWTSRL
jgi:hypothetical protein